MSSNEPQPEQERIEQVSDQERLARMRDSERAWLERELLEAHKTNRELMRQIKKEQQAHAEVTRAYNKTVANLVEAMRENTALTLERDRWKARAQGIGASPQLEGLGSVQLSAEEVSAIRKAMARLHHPDTGGDIERMKIWNAILDRIEQQG